MGGGINRRAGVALLSHCVFARVMPLRIDGPASNATALESMVCTCPSPERSGRLAPSPSESFSVTQGGEEISALAILH